MAVMLEDGVKPGDLASRLLETLVLTTDDAKQPEVEVAVLIEPKALSRPGRARPGS